MTCKRTIDADKLNQLVTEHANTHLEWGHIAGGSLRVFQDGKELLSMDVGVRNGAGAPVEKNTLFRLASMTKPVVAALVLAQAERGKLSLDDEITRYIPKFAGIKVEEEDGTIRPATRVPTIRELLSHTSGLGSDKPGWDMLANIPDEVRKDLHTVVDYYTTELPLSFDPGARRSYSPVAAFDVLGEIAAMTADTKLYELAEERIFRPLGMTDTTFVPGDEQFSRLSEIHYRDENGKSGLVDIGPHIFDKFPLSYHTGGAGLVGSADDYSVFAEMLLHGGVARGERILTERSIEQMRTPIFVPGDAQENPGEVFGLGVRVIVRDRDDSPLPIGTFGWSGAYGTHFWVDPTDGITAVYLKNSTFDGGAGCITACLLEKDVMESLR